jgi:hypothetical protein
MSTWPSVRTIWIDVVRRFEGWTTWMYEDRLGLMTTGMGNLIDTQPPSSDPTGTALSLPWQVNGAPASAAQIAASWHAVRARPDLRTMSGYAYENIAGNDARLTDAGVEALITQKFDQNSDYLSKRFPNFGQWPADAQLAVHMMAWAMGPAFKYPKFEAATSQNPPDFMTMAAESAIQGEAVRSELIKLLLMNAASAQKAHADPSHLFYPGPVAIAAAGAGVGTLLVVGGVLGLVWSKLRDIL